MNQGHPFLIYGLCKNVVVPLEDNEVRIQPIKAIVVKENKLGVPRFKAVYDSGHEPSDDEELIAYQMLFFMQKETPGEAGQPSTTRLPPPSPPTESNVPSPSLLLEDQIQDLTSRFDAYWDETQEHQVTMSQEMDALKANMHIVMSNQQAIQQ